ncbi:hypothetical protein CALVIDRAFT_185266 [Calocera viscosa TUFC12733]|uniref:Nephrocystin 3-like N-terminal domain-containing protein n=1 Tax=Calocera viscosa (strain TUFC12733) TaxID=1330018 RepID=A0A167KSB5_CALVF|nr:hypothetical protein CALVIDRAFT_185266 [Calocera viscosa TUFC12733]
MSESSSLVASSSMTNRAKQVFERFRESAIEVPARRLANAGMQITGLTKALDENRKEWHAFAKYVEDSITRIHDLPHTAFLAPTAQERLEQLLSTLKELLAEVNSYEERGVVQKLALTGASEHAPGEMRKKLDEALFLSNLEFTIANGVELAKVVGTLDDMRQALSALSSTLSEQTPLREPLPNEIMALPYGRGMSWDPEKMCLPGTRVELLDEIWNWINAPNDGSGAKLFWLVDVAGSGKTTVAHTVSNRAAEAGQLLLSYFFTRSDSQNSVASTFVTTLATHMARHSHHTATRMASRLRADISLSSAPVARQFRDLIVQSQLQDTDDDDRAKDPQVIVIDALDECTDRGEAMVRILLSAMQELPSNIRIFITSRPVPEMLDSLEYLTRVRKREIGLYTEANFRDLRLYMTQRLPLVIRRTRNACDIDDIHFRLHRRAEGLFLWVSTVTTFLHRCINPDRQLEAILSSNNNDSEADKPMDSLYELVLSDCPWDDVDFREGYRRYMGLMLAAAKPLTYSIFEQLNPDANIPSKAVFERLSALLGVGRLDEDGNLIRDEDVTIRVLHSSLQTYLFHRAPPRYRFHYQSLHAQMAQNCLKILTKDLDELYRSLSVHGCWWRALTGWSEPNISVEDCVSLLAEVAEFEEIHVCDLNPHLRDRMQYACCDGIRHLIRVQSPAPNLLHLLQNLLATGVLSLVCSSFILCCQNWLADLLLWLKVRSTMLERRHCISYSILPSLL